MSTEVKQVIVVRKDLNMRKGKIASQVAHASMKVVLDLMQNQITFQDDANSLMVYKQLAYRKNSAMETWLTGKFTKVCVSVDSEFELLTVYRKAIEQQLLCSLITDAGLTEFHGVPTLTCCAIGPNFVEEIDPLTGHLKLL